MTLEAAADGSSLGNPGPAGWAWVIDQHRWRAGGWPSGTNNQGELMAVIDLLESTAHLAHEPLRVLCDSKYVIDSVTKWMPGWKRKGWRKADGKPVLNRDLFERMDRALTGRNVQFEWVKGHAGHALNEAADLRARAAATAFQRGNAPEEGPGLSDGSTAPPIAALSTETTEVSSNGNELFTAEEHRDPLAEVGENERSLFSSSVRSNRRLLDSLIHPNFRMIGADGGLYGREAAIEFIMSAPRTTDSMSLIDSQIIAPGIVQVVCRTSGTRNEVHTSLWQLDGDAYKLHFRQGTRVLRD